MNVSYPVSVFFLSVVIFFVSHYGIVWVSTLSFSPIRSFFARTILCNSLVWSCKYTGKSNLTYSEALKSERDVEKLGNSLCSPLQRAALYLVHHIQRGRLANLCDEVFSYLKDRYQEGEEVEVQYSGKR